VRLARVDPGRRGHHLLTRVLAALARFFRWLADGLSGHRRPPLDVGEVLAREQRQTQEEDRRRKEDAAREHRQQTEQLRTDLQHPPRTGADMVADAKVRLERLRRDDK
jgi:hypothetical protein